VSRGDGDLQLDQVEAGDLLGDGMFHLQACVHLKKVKIVVGVYQELDRTGVGIAAGAGQTHCGIAHAFAQLRRHDGRGSFFDHLLVAALHRAFALAERDHSAVRIG